MGKMQEALKKAEQDRSQVLSSGRGPAAPAPSHTTGTATSFALSGSSRAGEVDPHLVALTDPGSPQAAQYKALRDAVLASGDASMKVFLVTSAVPREGRSVTAVNLACSLAAKGDKRVVVVDADLRSPSIHQLLGVDNQRGLADYLCGGTMVEMILQRSRLPNLWALPAGRTPPNAAELVGGKRMDDLISRLRRDFDYVVIDSPPVVSTPDAGAIAPRTDGTILVVRMGRTPREVARHAVELLKKAKANVLGTVAAGVDVEAA
jgi:capsular exopolysaccharide synthesis family protein